MSNLPAVVVCSGAVKGEKWNICTLNGKRGEWNGMQEEMKQNPGLGKLWDGNEQEKKKKNERKKLGKATFSRNRRPFAMG